MAGKDQVAQEQLTHHYNLRSRNKGPEAKAKEEMDQHLAKIGISNKDANERKDLEEKDSDKKRIKAAKKLVKERVAQRRAVFSYKNSNEPQNDQSLASKLSRLNDLNPESLVGEYIMTFIFHMIGLLCARQFFVQMRAFADARELDRQKLIRIATGQAKDDGIRVAYQPLRNLDGTIQEDANGDPVYPQVYPVDEAGNIDFYQAPNTDGTASRAAIRANGFVPVEDIKESYGIAMLKFKQEFAGSAGMTNAQKLMLNQFVDNHAQEGQRQAERDIYGDNAVIASQAAANQAAAQRAAMKPATGK